MDSLARPVVRVEVLPNVCVRLPVLGTFMAELVGDWAVRPAAFLVDRTGAPGGGLLIDGAATTAEALGALPGIARDVQDVRALYRGSCVAVLPEVDWRKLAELFPPPEPVWKIEVREPRSAYGVPVHYAPGFRPRVAGFTIQMDPTVPPGEVHFRDGRGRTVGKITDLGT